MNDHKEHISHYSAADIKRYVQGKLSAPEMHAMEKAALDDPFLADAIEGMQQALTDHDESLVTGQLNQLQQQLQTRTGAAGGKVVAFKPFRYWQAVAAAVVVIITGVWLYSLRTSTSENELAVIAKTEEGKPKQQQAPAPAFKDSQERAVSHDSATAQGNAAQATNQPNTYKNNLSLDSKNKQDDVIDKNTGKYYRDSAIVLPPVSNAKPAPSVPVARSFSRQKTDSPKVHFDQTGADYFVNKDVAAEKKEAVPTATRAVPESMKARKQQNDSKIEEKERETELITIAKKDKYDKKSYFNNNLSGVIKGQVTDLNNNPVANAYVQITNNNNNFITDKTGFFKIPVTDSVINVAVNVTGYGTQNFRLQNNAIMNQLQLQPANVTLNKLIVPDLKGKNVTFGQSNYPSTMVHDAEPADGWAAFDQYLANNKKTRSGLVSAGHVVVSFQVNKKGTLSDFKIEQSLSKAYDDEAIRLIMQGPAWKLLKGRKARITVMVRF